MKGNIPIHLRAFHVSCRIFGDAASTTKNREATREYATKFMTPTFNNSCLQLTDDCV